MTKRLSLKTNPSHRKSESIKNSFTNTHRTVQDQATPESTQVVTQCKGRGTRSPPCARLPWRKRQIDH